MDGGKGVAGFSIAERPRLGHFVGIGVAGQQHGQRGASRGRVRLDVEGREVRRGLDEDGVEVGSDASNFRQRQHHIVPAPGQKLHPARGRAGRIARSGIFKGPGVGGIRKHPAKGDKVKGVVFETLRFRRLKRWLSFMDVQGEVGGGQEAGEALKRDFHCVHPGILHVCLGNGCGGAFGGKPIGTGPGVIGQGDGQGVVDELGHFELDIVAEAGGAHRLDGHRWTHAGRHFEHRHLFHGTAVGVHQRACAVVGLAVP